MNSTSFNIYNASAGSGKTFTLVKTYLKILLNSPHKDAYKHILAITFTNKAVGEMKDRIIEALKAFASTTILQEPNDLFLELSEDLSFSPKEIHEKANVILNSILHNYAAFDISTIDKFTQKLIRTFAYDLKLPMNFEVELDTEELLNKAVDNLISRAGSDRKLTKLLIDFAFEKADEDKSWDIAIDLKKIAKRLINENDIPFVETLKEKSLDDFKSIKQHLIETVQSKEEVIVESAKKVLALIEECGLEFNDFSSGFLPKHFKNLSNSNFNLSFSNKWQESIETDKLYPKRVSIEVASIIDEIQPQLALAFHHTKALVFELKFYKNFLKNITPLSVLNEINKELNNLKKEQNLLLISEFNSIISNEIKNQPAPFIYERIGEKFRHYFIDEFQDTSVMQWENLVPLISNALSGENASAMLVGDAKQAIYRWRGGRAEQFIDLFNKTNNPFNIEPKLEPLQTNYRSSKTIVEFNNSLFEHLSSFAFSNDTYSNLYKKSVQNIKSDAEGYVNLTFLEIDKDENKDEIYPKKVLETITHCLQNGFQLKDVCVLVRKKKEGVSIANFLNNNDIDIVSSETLSLHRSPEVCFIVNLLNFILQPRNYESKIQVLTFLGDYKFNISNKHDFYQSHINLDLDSFFESFKTFNISFNYNDALQLSIYEAIESIIYNFNLVKTSNAYVQFFLDFAFDYSQKNQTSLLEFLNHYESKKEALNIVSPQAKNAVQIMTIHKSKGLEFPVVIFPYANLNIYAEREPKEWFPLDSKKFNGFSHALLSYNKDFENFGETGREIYIQHQAELELDNINLLYVALTRAIEQLYIIGAKQLDKKGNENLKLYSGLLINYLKEINKWNDTETTYGFGNPKRTLIREITEQDTIEQVGFISTPKKEHNISIVTNSGLLWDTTQQEAIEKGNLIHHIMAQIKTKTDIDITLSSFLSFGSINNLQAQELKQIVTNIVDHPQLKTYFNSNNTVYNERDIITKDGLTLRPDRLVINSKNEAVIIDYKTGKEDVKHKQQLQSYEDALREMNCSVIKKILIYINNTLEIKEF